MIKSQFYSGQVVSNYRILEKLGGVGTAGMPRQPCRLLLLESSYF